MKIAGRCFALPLVAVCGGPWSVAFAQEPPQPPDRNAPSIDVEALPDRPELPDPLVCLDGTPVRTAAEWRNRRRPELVDLIQRYEYGYLPPRLPHEAKVTKAADLAGGKIRFRETELTFPDLKHGPEVKIRLGLFLPAEARGKLPVFLAIHQAGNQALLRDPAIPLHLDRRRGPDLLKPNQDPETLRGTETDFWCVEYVLSRGFAFAAYHQTDVDFDGNDFADGLHPHFEARDLPAESRPGTIAAWAWGFGRCVDRLVQEPEIDPDRVCLIGHSRRGKTALLAAALDERVALVVPHQSGTGGMALCRGNDQETVERINRVFPHWFADAFVKFGGRERKLPFDQHCVAALVAPRALFDTEGEQDRWANFDSGAKTVRAASPVWKLLGAKGALGTGIVKAGEPMNAETVGELVQFRLNAKHTLNRDFWTAILDFAELHFKTRTPAR